MGSSCSQTCCNQNEFPNLADEINPHWVEAVEEANTIGITCLHQDDPEIIESPINKSGEKAIHLVARGLNAKDEKHPEYIDILQYLLDAKCDINSKVQKSGNTALHEAAIVGNLAALNLLIEQGADIEVKNRQGKTPKDVAKKKIVTKQFKKMNIDKARKRGEHYLKQKETKKSDAKKLSVINLQKSLKKGGYTRLGNEPKARNFRNLEKKSIHEMTSFGQKIGVDLNEVSVFVETHKSRRVLWNKSVGRLTNSITKERQLYKLLFYITQHTVARQKSSSNLKLPHVGALKDLTKRVRDKLKEKHQNNKLVLTKEEFLDNFHEILNAVHDELLMEGTKATKHI